jgi:hypothetical protein
MEILIPFTGSDTWNSKCYGAIFTKNESDKKLLYELLCEQDEYWKKYSDLVQILPTDIHSISDLQKKCHYVGKTDIYDVDELRTKVDFLIYQYYDDFDY